MNFECRVNPDKTFSLYNNEIEDIYFSNIGAYNEAIEKFVLPSNPAEFRNKTVKILDVCYGMGYNSKSFVDYCIKNNIDCDFEIDSIEIDKNILALGLFIFDENISDDINLIFGKNIISQINLQKNLENISGENWINFILEKFYDKFKQFDEKNEIYLHKNCDLSTLLHNIYYQNHDKLYKLQKIIKLNFILGDLLEILPKIEKKYDLIFHDAFSIRKQPDLWSDNVMNKYYDLLNNNGKLLTYSNSRVLKRLLLQIGYDVQVNYDNLSKPNGTIGIKNY